MDFLEIANDLAIIANTGSTLMKESLLKKYGSEVEGFKDVLKFIYDPYFTTGLGLKKLERAGLHSACDAGWIMNYLRQNTTGTDYDAAIANGFIYQSDDPAWQWAATGLVTKDLQCGVSVTTLNKVYGDGFIAKIGIMRGTLCPETAQGIYIATEKIDGNRRLIMNKHTGVEIYTRSGKRDYGLVDIEAQAATLPKGFVYDTECIAVGDFVDNIELRQASASILNSGGKRTGVRALVFDMLTQEEYDAGISKTSALGRKARLAGLFRNETSLKVLMEYFGKYDEQHNTHLANAVNAQFYCHDKAWTPLIQDLTILGIVHNKKEGMELAQPIWETGGEGIMLVEYRSPYEVNPNPRKTLLKIKATKEYVLKCVGVYQGDAGKKYADTLGGIFLSYRASDGNVYNVGCGSGFPDYLRNQYYNHPSDIVGKLVEIEAFGESRNAQGEYSLNCAIFKRIRGEQE